MMFGYGTQMSGWMWLLMGLGQLAFWGALIAAGLALFRSGGFAGSRSGRPHDGTPAQILAGRFARGDIDEAEYSRRLSVLHQHQGEAVPPDR